MAQGAKQLYFLYNPIMKVLVMGFSFAHILIQGADRCVRPNKSEGKRLQPSHILHLTKGVKNEKT